MADNEYYRARAWKRVVAIVVVLVIIAVLAWYFLRGGFEKIAAIEDSASNFAAQELSNKFSAPTPLVASSTSGSSAKLGKYTLTREGVIADTNAARAANGNLPPLAENATLDEVATIRLNDMFAKQYFSHYSPSSSSALTVASSVGYDYLELGENLALGNFAGDQGVVTAWMNSPGHRANILDMKYTQIGVAVGDGNFQGNNDWIAVQVFGRPASDCPLPDANLETEINSDESQIADSQQQLKNQQAAMSAMQPQSGAAYNQAVTNYNASVATYNALVAQAKSEVNQYNAQVSAFNDCLGS